MELKDIGHILRSHADGWKEQDDNPDDYSQGWDDGAKYCGETLSDLLDKCGVPKLEDEDE
jgi:hypothetical protein